MPDDETLLKRPADLHDPTRNTDEMRRADGPHTDLGTTSSFGAAPTTPELLRAASQAGEEAARLLREYRNSLRGLGMNLPGGSFDAIRSVSGQVESWMAEAMSEQSELRQLRALADNTALFHSAPDADHVLQQVMDTAIQLTSAERGFILLSDPERGALAVRIARGMDHAELGRDNFAVSRTIVNQVASTGQPVITDNARNDPRYLGNASIIGHQFRSILAVPLKVQQTIIGVLYCDNRALTGLFKPYDLVLLEAFADQAAVAIQNARLFDATREQLAAITRLRDMMDNIFVSISSGLIATDSSGRITVFNRAAERITGVRQTDALGQMIADALPTFTRQFRAELEAALFHGVQAQSEQDVLIGVAADADPLSGARIWSVHISPLRGTEGATNREGEYPILGVTIVLDDLTEQRAREAQIAQVRRYLPSALVEHISSESLAALGGEEREISVLFADVRGFTAFSEQLEPETLMQVINRYLAAASDAIDEYQGIVDKYIGDAVTALFNTQLNPQENAVERALRAALLIRQNVTRLHSQLPPESRLFFGIGVHTGAAILGNVGHRDRREFAALGDALEFSRLLQENAARGEIVLSAAAYTHVRHLVACEAVAPTKLKGRTDFTVLYRVVDAN